MSASNKAIVVAGGLALAGLTAHSAYAQWDGGPGTAAKQGLVPVLTKPLLQFGSPDTQTHISTQSNAAPTLASGCGTGSPTVVGTDVAGVITAGASMTTCTALFARAYVSTPFCVLSWNGPGLTTQSYTVTTAQIGITQTIGQNNKINYMCVGQQGG